MPKLTRPSKRFSLTAQFVGSLVFILAVVTLSLTILGYNAIHVADTRAADRQQRIALTNLAAEIWATPDHQRSATIWDDAVLRTSQRDGDWMDANLGTWMQEYFGHDESYILDQTDTPVFASAGGEVASIDAYADRAENIAPLVTALRAEMADVSEGLSNPYEELATVSEVAALSLDTGAAIVSIVPIISDTGEIVQAPGTESLHIAVRYLDAELAQKIGGPIELDDVSFRSSAATDNYVSLPVTDQSSNAIAWLAWNPERPGMQLLTTMLPVILTSATAIALFLWWTVHRLLRISGQLQISEERLRQSQKLEAVGKLTGGIAHDFNNLLTVIMGNTEIIQDSLDPDNPLRRYADMSAKAADRAAELTSRLLAFSRKQALQPQVADVHAIVMGIEAMLRRTLTEEIDIRIIAPKDLWQTEVDPGQLESALLNLAINSRDAMPDGGALTIEMSNVRLNEAYVAHEQSLTSGEFVLIAFSDTGHGIPKTQIDRVFEPFFTTKEVGKGTGLGLSMVYGFLKQTGGHISVYSEPGEGTTVKLYFPRHYGANSAPQLEAEDVLVQHGRETILVVEDAPLILQQVAAQLGDLGYKVVTAPEGALALTLLQERPDISMLLTDIILPGGMNGKQLAIAAKAIRPDLKILYTTGYSESAILHQGRLDRGVEVLSKPYRRADLAMKVRKVLDLQG